MTDLLGKTIGQYQLIELINETGTTFVYKAFQPEVSRYVAIKILKPSIALTPEASQRFQQQSDLLAQFDHPRLLEVFETGETEGIIFRVMRWAEQGSLHDHLAIDKHNPFFALDRTLLLFQEIVEGLEHIHSQGFTHGNIKPANILLDSLLHPLLTDFGLPGEINEGSSPFLAPEQVKGGVVDRRADIYALGALLYTVLVGISPPTGAVVSPRSSRPTIPESVEMVIFKAMAQNPDQRHQTALEFYHAFQSAITASPQNVQPIATTPPTQNISQTVNVGESKKAITWVGLMIALLFLIMCCVGGYFIYRAISSDQSSEEPTIPQPPAITQVLPTRELRPTREPRPTRPPIQWPEFQLPTRPTEQPTSPAAALEPPTQPEEEDSNFPIELPSCGSIGLVGIPLILLGIRRLYGKP